MATQNYTVVYFNGPSDGNPLLHPLNGQNGYYQVDDTRLRTILAKLWATEYEKVWSKPVRQPGPYILSNLPSGFAIFEKQRLTDPAKSDRYVFGRSGGGKYRSGPEFFPHLMYLASYMPGDRCECKLCTLTWDKYDQAVGDGTAQIPRTVGTSSVGEVGFEAETEEDGSWDTLGLETSGEHADTTSVNSTTTLRTTATLAISWEEAR